MSCLHGTEVRARGAFELEDDLSDIERVSDGGYFFLQPLDPALRIAFVNAANHIGSSFEQNHVLVALVNGEQR